MSVAWILDQLKIDEFSIEEMGEVVSDTGWSDDRKWQHRSVVYDMTCFHPDQGNPEDWPPSDHEFTPGYYRINESRSGSYWNDYEYLDPTVEEVIPYTETITKYKKVL